MIETLRNKLLQDVSKTSILEHSKRLNIPYTTLYRIVHGEGDCRLGAWAKIEQYYSKRPKQVNIGA